MRIPLKNTVLKNCYQVLEKLHLTSVDPILNHKIFFLHIPKCGGTSIHKAINNCYMGRTTPKRSNSFRLNAAACLKGSNIANAQLGEYTKSILPYYMSLKNMAFISGHFSFCDKCFSAFHHEWSFITILRHPVSRWFSHYFYNRYKADDHFRIDDDIVSYLHSDEGKSLGHFYIYLLTGKGSDTPTLPDSAIPEAISILDKFSLIGFIEHLDVFKKNFKSIFGPELHIGNERINPASKNKQNRLITDEIKQEVGKICAPDIELYEHALSNLKRE